MIDACDEALFEDPTLAAQIRVCPPSAVCRPRPVILGLPPEVLGDCVAASARPFAACERPDETAPSRPDPCGESYSCTSSECSRVSGSLGGRVAGESVCFPPVREGGACDSNLADREVWHAESGFVRLGCDPCEEGTFCLDDPRTETSDPRCVRPCTGSDGAADSAMCACGRAICKSWGPTEQIHEATGESLGTLFCEPCRRSNTTCVDGVPCCDTGLGAACNPSPFLSDGENTVCCRAAGSACDTAARFPQCCEDAICTSTGAGGESACLPCGIDGAPPVDGRCCPGHVLTGVQTASPICRRCARSETTVDTRDGRATVSYCGTERFEVLSSDGVDAPHVPSSTVPYPHVFEGLIGGRLIENAGDAQTVLIDLGAEYRGYLLEGDILGGITAGAGYVELPRDDVPGPSPELASGLTTAGSFLLDDLGACSARLSWDTLAAVLASAVHQEVAARAFPFDGSAPLIRGVRSLGLTLTPVLRAAEAETYGLLHERSSVHVVLEYEIASLGTVLTCGPNVLRLEADVSIQLRPGLSSTPASLATDALLGEVGCGRSGDGSSYVCFQPSVLPGGAIGPPETRTFPRRANLYANIASHPDGPELSILDLLMATTRCDAVRNQYRCAFQSVVDDAFCDPAEPSCPCTAATCASLTCSSPFGNRISCTPGAGDPYAPFLAPNERTLPRAVGWPDGARDLDVVISGLGVDLLPDGCVLEEVATGLLRGQILAALDGRVGDELLRALRAVLGGSATVDFGIDPATLPACFTDPDCPELFGGLRWGCPDPDGDPRTPSICDAVRVEPRRHYVGPRGIDIVLADGPDDPQATLLAMRAFPAPPAAFPDDGVSCAPDRFAFDSDVVLSTGEPASRVPGGVGTGASARWLADTPAGFCDPAAAPSRTCICRETGVRCDRLTGLTLAGFSLPGGGLVPLTCTAGRCCDAATGTSCATSW